MANHVFLPKNSEQQEKLGSSPLPDIVKSVLERDCLGQQAFPGEEGGNFRGALQWVRAANTVTLLWFLAKPRSLAFRNPNCCLSTGKGVLTLALIWALACSTHSVLSLLHRQVSDGASLVPWQYDSPPLVPCHLLSLLNVSPSTRLSLHGIALLPITGVSRRGGHRVDQAGIPVHPKMPFHAKEPLVSFTGLVHLWLPFPLLVLRGGGGMTDIAPHHGETPRWWWPGNGILRSVPAKQRMVRQSEHLP